MIKDIKRPVIFFISILIVLFTLFYYLASIFMPFLVAALLAYLSNPLVKQLVEWKFSRLLSVVIVFFLLFFTITLFLLLFIPLIQSQIATLTVQVPAMLGWLETKIVPWLTAHLGTEKLDLNSVKNYVATNVVKTNEIAAIIFHSGKTIFHILLNMILIPVVTFYLLRDWDLILVNIRNILPKKIRPTILELTYESDSVLSAFFKGQLLVMLFLGVVYAVMLSLYGLQLGIIIGIIIGLTSIVPYLGLIVGLFIATLAALVQFGSLSSLTGILIIFLIGHSFENFYLTPKLIGDRIGLHPVVVIFSILAGGALFGFFGVLLALPVAAVSLVLLRHIHSRFYQAESNRR